MNNGVLLKIDSLGRIVIPVKFRESLNIEKNKYLIMSLEKDNIKICKYEDNDYLDLLYNKFCNIWIENNREDTIIISNLYGIKYVLGKSKEHYLNKIINKNIFNVINDEYFSYKKFRDSLLFEKGEFIDFDVFALYDKESRIGNLIIIRNSKEYEYNMKFVYDILYNI